MAQRYVLRSISFLFSAVLLFSASMAQGDTCTTALLVVSGVHFADGPTTGDGINEPPPGNGCSTSAQNGDWYRYVPSFTGMITITSCHPLNNQMDDDTYLKVMTGACGSLTCISMNDDMGASACPNYGFASFLQVNVTAGENYYIVWVDAFDSDAFYWELSECAGTVVGETYRDANSNGQRDAGENHASTMLQIEPGGHFAYSSQDPYSFCSDMGSYTITVPNPPLYHTAAPASQAYTVAALGTQITGMDFGFQPIPGIYDGAVDLWGWNPWIGNNTNLNVHYSNIGTEPITASLMLTLDPLVSFVSASVLPGSVTGQDVSWTLGSLAPGASGTISVTIHTASTATPNAPIQNSVVLQITETDIALDNNSDILNGIATTSFDPNDKQVDHTVITPMEVADQKKLEYAVRFQNTGNAPAVNVVVKDSLDADWDLGTFEMIGATHPYTLTINNEVAIWTFANIMLPDSATDALGSQGSFQYRMAPKTDLLLGEQLTNRADIYFDFNVPVLTNTTVTTVALSAGFAESALANGLFIAPSPGNGIINLRWADARLNNARFTVIDAMGRVVFTTNLSGSVNNTRSMDLSFLPEGSYVARLIGDRTEAWTRVVIQR